VNSPKTLQMTGVPVDDWKLQLQANQIFNASSRITRAMVEIALQSMQMQTCVSVLKLEQAIETRCYSEFSTIWSQFDAIGQKHSATLFNHVKTIQQLKVFDHFQLECLIGKATAQKLKESVAKLPIFAPQVIDVCFVDRHLVTQECTWEVKMLVQSSSTLRECRVNIVAGIWHGAASIVKRHYLLQESGPANCITFNVKTKSNEKHIIVHMAVSSCSHAGIDREIIYKCAINWAEAKKPSISRIEEINEKTLEVLGKKKTEVEASKDFVEEFQETEHLHDAPATQAKPRQKIPKDSGTINSDEPMKFTEKQLGLLPNKALKTVAQIKTKKGEQRLEWTDDEDELVFQEELFKHMDHPISIEQNNLRHDARIERQRVPRHRGLDDGIMQERSAQIMNQGFPLVSKSVQQNSFFSFQESNPVKVNQLQWRDAATRLGEQHIQNEQEPIRESRNPFASFAYQPEQKELTLSRNPQVIEKIPDMRALAQTSEQKANIFPRKITFDNDPSMLATGSQAMNPRSNSARFEGMPWCAADSEQKGNLIHAQRIEQTKTITPQNNVVQVVKKHCFAWNLLKLTPSLQLLSMYKTLRGSRVVSNFDPQSNTTETENQSLKNLVSNRAASIV
jgi:hypothetical protein